MEFEIPTKFVNAPSGSLFCPLCEKLFQDPVISIACGHTFCRPCVDNRLITIPRMSCPVDNAQVELNNLVPNKAVQGQLEDLLIYCRHGLIASDSNEEWDFDEDGCREQIKLGDRHEHEDTCLMVWMNCPNSKQCTRFRKESLNDHLMGCPYHVCPNESKGILFVSNMFLMPSFRHFA